LTDNRIWQHPRPTPIVLDPSIPGSETQALIKTCLTGVIDEIILFYFVETGLINMKAVIIVLDGVELEGVQAASSDVDAELATVTDAVPENGIVVSTPK